MEIADQMADWEAGEYPWWELPEGECCSWCVNLATTWVGTEVWYDPEWRTMNVWYEPSCASCAQF